VWALAGAIVAAITLVFLLRGFVGAGTLLTMSLCVRGGAAAAYLRGPLAGESRETSDETPEDRGPPA
jgi:hypothetical protein